MAPDRALQPMSLVAEESVLVLVLPHQVSGYWIKVEPMIEKALTRGGSHLSALNIFEKLLTMEMLLWLSKRAGRIEACCVTQIVNYPLARVVFIILISGSEMENWLRFERDITDYAKRQYCTEAEGYGRLGWLRAAPEGLEPVHVLLRKKL